MLTQQESPTRATAHGIRGNLYASFTTFLLAQHTSFTLVESINGRSQRWDAEDTARRTTAALVKQKKEREHIMKTLKTLTFTLALAASVVAASAQDNSNQPAGRGSGRGYGLRDGTGPRARMGTCPMVNDNPSAAVAPAPGNRGPGFGVGNQGGRGQGKRGGWGLRDGTGPRAQWGGCPFAAGNAPAALNPASDTRGPAYGTGFCGGRGWGGGPRNGTGPRAQAGTCPLVNPPAK